MASKQARVAALALASRALVLGLMALFDASFRDLDTSTRLQNRPCDRDLRACMAPSCPEMDAPPSSALDALATWDAAFFVRIAKCGYETDMIHAFFPGVPLAMRAAVSATALRLLKAALPVESLYAAAGLALSAAAFCGAAVLLHKLGGELLRDESLADLSTVLFCLNPASVFHSAPYTEAPYALLSFAGMWLLPRSLWAGAAAFAGAAAVRSNGILYCGFIGHRFLADCTRTRRVRPAPLLATAGACALVLAPYLVMQVRAFLSFCRSAAVDPAPGWCAGRLPSVYGFVQREYWDVGFLRFYAKVDRWPKVLMSMPVAALSFAGVYSWLAVDRQRALTLGLAHPAAALAPAGLGGGASAGSHAGVRAARQPSGPLPVQRRSPDSALRRMASPTKDARGSGYSGFTASDSTAVPAWRRRGYYADALAPFIYYWAFLTAFALLVMHVNVATRFLSTCPPLYWFAAHWVLGGGARRSQAVWLWCLGFTLLGALLFPNFYPWT